ncbi:hypothetical protein [Actinophytocola glycyrrhizae]|uniref:Uncharacterized protein n=1 Tax=Actinophytocola glycyrrhizae TaxID=2044873 RepID=A0ABV9S3S7_9PSEU
MSRPQAARPAPHGRRRHALELPPPGRERLTVVRGAAHRPDVTAKAELARAATANCGRARQAPAVAGTRRTGRVRSPQVKFDEL